METQIHGVPTPPLGYRLANKSDAWIKGLQVWYPTEGSWQPSAMPKVDGLDADFIYAVPLDDGYEYFEAGSTVIQEGDEWGDADGVWHQLSPHSIGSREQYHPLRRPKAKPSPLAQGRNIGGLTEEQVGVADGWRLITEEEFENLPNAEVLDNYDGWITSIFRNRSGRPCLDYRTKDPLPGTKETKRYFFGFGTIHSKDYLLSEGNAKLIENLLDALKEEKE